MKLIFVNLNEKLKLRLSGGTLFAPDEAFSAEWNAQAVDGNRSLKLTRGLIRAAQLHGVMTNLARKL
ncbi:hypothetical protein O3Q51_00330 [Cryomorphaceae bacterium 1068]|nr:hypothetical protein [Cryomorphaceae bacterium 1068]